jgi:hypothetical protein
VCHYQPVSIKGIGLFGQALLEVSHAIVAVISSRPKLIAMEDFAGRQAEDELRLKVWANWLKPHLWKRKGLGMDQRRIRTLRKRKKNRQKEKRIKEITVPAILSKILGFWNAGVSWYLKHVTTACLRGGSVIRI